MIAVSTTDENHEVIFIPRATPIGVVKFDLINEVTKDVYTTNLGTYEYENGLFSFNFAHNFNENDKYTVVFSDESRILYRDKLISTSQSTQNFKSSNYLYYYE